MPEAKNVRHLKQSVKEPIFMGLVQNPPTTLNELIKEATAIERSLQRYRTTRHGTGHVRRECKVPRCSRCRRFGHGDAECVRSYATVTASAEAEDASEHIMDVTEAEDAAEGCGDQVAENLNCTSATSVDESTPAPVDTQPGSAAVSTDTADNAVTDAGCEVDGASAYASEQGQVVDGASCSVGLDTKIEGNTCNASRVSWPSGAVSAIKRPLEDPVKTADKNSASSVEEPPA
ncbi:hypothetical protein HPB51_019415 [Rhipicephalus microplus]|uniref:Tick transposon n=1 Tax=Rhipicephalus microplus TaxID=6941 RepID=A0A9J6EP64_RHIMP|nr:hypothetical protein HPB51_019415 [Rhipicephalus microplus]